MMKQGFTAGWLPPLAVEAEELLQTKTLPSSPAP
jgi:hypothetical protein